MFVKLRTVIIIVILTIVGFVSIATYLIKRDNRATEARGIPAPQKNIEQVMPRADELFSLINEQRKIYNLPPLARSSILDNSARDKCNDIVSRNYWSHNAPDGTKPWDFIDKYSKKYIKAGENLAFGYNTSTDVVNSWMNSKTHKDNIVSPDYTLVGYAVCKSDDFLNRGPEYIIVQHFSDKI